MNVAVALIGGLLGFAALGAWLVTTGQKGGWWLIWLSFFFFLAAEWKKL